MLRRSLAVAIVMCTSACLDREPPAGDDAFTPVDGTHATSTAAVGKPFDTYDPCEHLPAEPPCSLLCDHDALVEQYVPENTCAVFVCELTDGQTVSLHACHPAD